MEWFGSADVPGAVAVDGDGLGAEGVAAGGAAGAGEDGAAIWADGDGFVADEDAPPAEGDAPPVVGDAPVVDGDVLPVGGDGSVVVGLDVRSGPGGAPGSTLTATPFLPRTPLATTSITRRTEPCAPTTGSAGRTVMAWMASSVAAADAGAGAASVPAASETRSRPLVMIETVGTGR
ncbi:hypothetical protein [Nonomuraea sp. SYSU D8015]|uniref:hypothetical protein n=1 Tax=Nonomuraea sp. SYSU D8015 TaxID=2593644 RepID=UPI001660F66B|nr:hypothetical protein [Nonomuraea sp. SYSU D8015]